jgi:hypothetical protein
VGQNDGCIDQSNALGSVTAGAQATIGGLAGANNGSVAQSYANEILTGGAATGGLVGSNAGAIRESYAASTLTPGPGSNAGGIAGTNGGRIATGVFWNSESSGVPTGVGAGAWVANSSGLTDDQMRQPASFGPAWDFSAKGTWSAGYFGPVLRWVAGS